MLRFVAEMMVVMSCGISTLTKQSVGSWEFVGNNSITNSTTRSSSFWKFVVVFFGLTFSLLVLTIFPDGIFELRSLLIFITAFYISFIVSIFIPQFFVLFAIDIIFMPFYTFFAPVIFFMVGIVAGFTIILISIFVVSIFSELIKWFCLFALATGLCYDGLRHLLFLNRSLCLGPAGSTYFPSARFIIFHSHLMSRRNSHRR